MTTFTITNGHNITAHATAKEAAALGKDVVSFTTERELAKVTADWPISQFAETWNAFAGVVPFDDLKPVKKFTDRKTSVGRIWMAIQRLATDSAARVRTKAVPAPKSGKRATHTRSAPAARDGSKKAKVLALLERKHGATLAELMQTTGWQAHSVRGFLSGSLGKKMGLTIGSTRQENGERTYSVAR